ncbi:uncharacterized protein LOC128674239 [Plodia interpunctella]|uniref:uncharacterized protein LOC128674239 n=1 Tax=Plodia interpunctella TaxID=58824 RepID=UPI00236764B7|nr:uncharacterized protein LOC128674239 [Plodia interpunctella]
MSSNTNILLTRGLRLISSKPNVLVRNKGVWTPENIVKSPYKDVEIPNITLVDHIWEKMDRWADKTAIICGVTKRNYTYNQLHKFSRNLAANLRKKFNIKDGDVVCVMMPNSPDYPLAVIGALQAGAKVTTVNPVYTPHEVSRQITLSRPRVLIGIPELIPILKEAIKLSNISLPIISCKGYTNDNIPEGTISFDELALDTTVDHSILGEVNRNAEDTALLPYSSGTTGLPKGVQLTNKNIVANCVQQDVDEIKYYEDTTASYQDRILAVLPFYHIYGLSITLLHKLSVGVKVVSLPKFQPQSFLNTMKEEKITLLNAAPPIVLFMGSHPDLKKDHLQYVNLMTSGAAPLPKLDVDRVLDKGKEGLIFANLYGLTETSPLATAPPKDSKDVKIAGYPVPNSEARIVDSNMRSLGPNEIGELLIRGPHVMKGYRDNIEATKNSITEEGWLKTGDLASMDKNGGLIIADRLKELIKVKGFQVPPAELEHLLREHPDVQDAGVVGFPDARTGEVPKAFVVLKDGSNANTRDIIDFVNKRVAEFKRIKDVVLLDSLPKNPSGKLLRRVLKEQYS